MAKDLNSILWTSDEVAEATGGEVTKEFEAIDVCMDSRLIKPGSIFVALDGAKVDGHKYVEKAFKDGAVAAIVKKDFNIETGKALVKVEDPRQAMVDMGAFSRSRMQGKVIAITGSAGKTGTKELLSIALQESGKSYTSIRSYNSFTGVPFCLSNMPRDTEYGIFEIGMSNPGEIEQLVKQVRPHMAVITTIEPVHIECFENGIEGIADAKAEIFSYMEGEAVAILNKDNPHFQRLKDKALGQQAKEIVTFGEDEEADCVLTDCKLSSGYIKATADVMGDVRKYRINIPGKHIALNSLSVLATVKSLGANLDAAVKALKKAETVNGRGNRISVTIKKDKPPVIIIDESYNANPSSMQAAFNVFEISEPEGEGRRVAVLGDMLELGKVGPQAHIDLANPLLKAKVDIAFCCGPLMEALYNTLPEPWQGGWAKDSVTLAKMVVDNIKPGDVVLVKGSNGMKTSYVIHELQELEVKG